MITHNSRDRKLDFSTTTNQVIFRKIIRSQFEQLAFNSFHNKIIKYPFTMIYFQFNPIGGFIHNCFTQLQKNIVLIFQSFWEVNKSILLLMIIKQRTKMKLMSTHNLKMFVSSYKIAVMVVIAGFISNMVVKGFMKSVGKYFILNLHKK